jgi:Fe-S-cluster-containing dehydrogenase component
MGITVKEDRCAGCRTCQVVCSLENFNEVNPSKAALGIEGQFPEPGGYSIRSCDQCGDCAEICPSEAIYLEDEGYRIDDEKCVACLMCMMVCSSAALFRHKELQAPIKCTFCGECIELCSRDALFDEDELEQEGGYN